MKKIVFTLLISCALAKASAQTGIGTITPNTSAKLDIYSTNKGFLPPRISLTDALDQSTIPSPATGLLVYSKGDGGLASGYYFWNGSAWATIATAGGSGSVAAEFGSQFQGATVSIANTTPLEVLSFTLPTAGIWEVISFLRSQGTPTFIGGYAIYDPAGTMVANSEILAAYGQNAATATGVIRIQTTGAATYKLKAWASLGSYNVMTNSDGRTGVTWQKISGNTPLSFNNYGDVKTGFQTADHNGWVKLNGRAKSTLSSTQQTQATAVGIASNLPDATNTFLVQNGTAIGSVSSSNTKAITQANLPNVTLGGVTSTDGSHKHTVNVNDNQVVLVSDGAVTSMAEGNSNWTSGAVARSANVIGTAGSHLHTITTNSLNGGVTQTQIDITPKSLSVNTFIYLGY